MCNRVLGEVDCKILSDKLVGFFGLGICSRFRRDFCFVFSYVRCLGICFFGGKFYNLVFFFKIFWYIGFAKFV